MKKSFLLVALFMSALFSKEVTVSILPQKYFVEKIAGDKIEVNVMVAPGSSPATYEPKTSQMKLLSKSLAYFAIDVPFEKVWLEKFETANSKMLIVDTADGIQKLEIQKHEHHDEDVHEHSGLDPHIWLDPLLVKIQAKNIYEALVKIDVENSSFYKTNFENFEKELDSLNEQIRDILKPYAHKAFMVFHPSWGYFANRYDLEQIAIEVQGKEPKPAQLVELVQEAKKHDIKIVFVSPQFSQKGAQTISKSINGNVAVINPLSEKWDENLIKVAKDIANTYK